MDSERLTEIFEKMRRKLQRAARAIVGDADEAEDAVQDVFCTLWSRRTLIRDNGEAERIIRTSIRNRCISSLRVRSRHRSVGIDEDSEIIKTEADIFHSKGSEYFSENDAEDPEVIFREVKSVITTTLTERDSEILMLRDHSGWEFDEIAEKFDMTPSSVRMALSRARKSVLKAYRDRKL